MSIRRPRKSSPQRSGRIPDRAHPRDKGSRSRKVTANFVVEGHSMTNQVPENAHLTLHERLNPASYVPSTSLPKSLTFHAKQGSDALSAQPWPCFRRIHSREDSPLVINWALTPGFPLKKLTFDAQFFPKWLTNARWKAVSTSESGVFQAPATTHLR